MGVSTLNNVQLLVAIFYTLALCGLSDAFSRGPQESPLSSISRRDYWKVSLGVVGGIAYGKLVGDTLYRISQGIERPAAHEQRVEQMIALALVASAASKRSNANEPFRILEVGIGTDCRLIRRGLYEKGLSELSANHVSQVELIGTDPLQPSKATLQKARDVLSQDTNDRSMNVDLNTISEDITSGLLPYSSGYFDSVICCLTLCSVDNQEDALREMKRLIRPNGGTFGFVEHVAVAPEEPYRFLEWQQEFLDPLQQRLADNCHLHRYTDVAIDKTFLAKDEARLGVWLEHERFLVNDMWPVSCQASGVIQMVA